ncbi:MAG: Smr/MutS family protein [Deltaproteobacteria bacterium]|nr:Smr/MutS family protein [Deltaproteobacteria bacterium]
MAIDFSQDAHPEAASFRILELDRVLALVAARACTAAAKAALTALQPAPVSAAPRLREALKEAAAFKALIRDCGAVPLAGIEDLRPFLEEVRFPGSWLPPRELLILARTLAALEGVCAYRENAAARAADLYQPVASVFAGIESFAPLFRLIESCINEDEEIRDNASLELQDIRRRIVAARRQISTHLSGILSNPDLQPFIQDNLVTIRNQRYVLPLKTNFRGTIPGIIHDHSRTRQTCFVEPLESVLLNNNLALLLQEERQEEINILSMIADRLRQATAAIVRTLLQILALDQLQAKALFAEEIKASAPVLLESWTAGFSLKAARHPLLAAGAAVDRVVAIDLEFPPGRCGLVISGANTGGKTVSLKTAGLIILMARCGLLLPVSPESRVPLFSLVLAAIGDEQNLAASLSTFSGHLLAVKAILGKADAASLVLLDELGVGTDPKEGAALAQAVLMELKKRRVTFIVTTHYNDVKSYAYEEEGVSSVAVAFDPAIFKPLYHLQYGVPGLSNAFLIARNLGFSEELLEQARSLLDEGENRITRMAVRLEKRLAHTAGHEKELLQLKQQARIEIERGLRLSAELAAEKEKLQAGAREQIAILVKEARQKFKARLAELEMAKQVLEAATAAAGKALLETPAEIKLGRLRNAFNEVRDEVYELLPPAPTAGAAVNCAEIAVGDRVQVAGQTKMATVAAIDASRKRFTVVLEGNLRVTLSPDKISRHLPGAAPGARSGGEGSVRIRNIVAEESDSGLGRGTLGVTGPAQVLNLIGKRVEEAVELLTLFIDQSIVSGQAKVEIIHGHGTGRLRQGLHESLKTLPYVSNFYHPEAASGGAAVTIVELVQR